MNELGKIQRPEAGAYSGRRKLYCVANIYAIEDAPEDFRNLIGRYWDEVVSQIEKVEAAGKIKKIFCEIVSQKGEESLEMWSKINERVSEIIRTKIGEGGELIPIEDEQILGQYTDWGNCLRVVFTQQVFARVLEFYSDFADKRLQHIIGVIDSSLPDGEAGLLIMKDEDRAKLQFPADIEVFLITPPSYDDIVRWFRDRFRKKSNEHDETAD
jgi:hypothetical protein